MKDKIVLDIKTGGLVLITALCILLLMDCSSRLDPDVNNEYGDISYSPKDTIDIDAEVLLYKGSDDEGRPLITNIFTIGDKSKVYASVKILHRELHPGSNVMVHADWIDPDGNSFFMKREDVNAVDPLAEINSAISIPPDRRKAGEYKFRVYLFRELVAEKNFKLVNYNADSAVVFPANYAHPVSASIVLGSGYDRDNLIVKDTATVFEIKNNGKVYSGIKLINKEFYARKEFAGEIAWCGEDGKPFYSKSFKLSPYDTSLDLNSAVSSNPKSRKPGNYTLKVFLYNKLIGEKSFKLIPETEKLQKSVQVKGIKAELKFCSKVGKKTKKAYGISDNFTVEEKGSIYAVVNIADNREKPGKSEIKIEWISPEGKSFYSKNFKFGQTRISELLSTSVSKKRRPGKYICRVYFNKSIIAENTFTLSQ